MQYERLTKWYAKVNWYGDGSGGNFITKLNASMINVFCIFGLIKC
jgi:hypothetical protein